MFFKLLTRCKAAFVVISIVVWDAVPLSEADNMYKLLLHKLNKFGLPTTRRCATNENRTCACQGNIYIFFKKDRFVIKNYFSKVWILRRVVLLIVSDARGQCTIMDVNMLDRKQLENFDCQ